MDIERFPERDFLPMTIVWCPIPLLTWLLPFVGHLGIVTSDGLIHDFAGPYTINKSRTYLAFGRATKYIEVAAHEFTVGDQYSNAREAWDDAIEKASGEFEHRMHTLLWNNCHSHVAYALNRINYGGRHNWNTLFLILLVMFYGKHINSTRTIATYGPFLVIITVIGVLVALGFVLF